MQQQTFGFTFQRGLLQISHIIMSIFLNYLIR